MLVDASNHPLVTPRKILERRERGATGGQGKGNSFPKDQNQAPYLTV